VGGANVRYDFAFRSEGSGQGQKVWGVQILFHSAQREAWDAYEYTLYGTFKLAHLRYKGAMPRNLLGCHLRGRDLPQVSSTLVALAIVFAFDGLHYYLTRFHVEHCYVYFDRGVLGWGLQSGLKG